MVAEERRTMTQTRNVMVQMSVQIEETPIPLQLILAVEGVQEMQHQQCQVIEVSFYHREIDIYIDKNIPIL